MLEKFRKIAIKKFKHKRTILLVVLLCCVFGLLIGNMALAQTASEIGGAVLQGVGTAVATVLSWIAYVFLMLFGLLLTLLIKILVNVAQFNNIIDVSAVEEGWIIVRDLCNMFFVLIVLVIAFATILKYENYSVKKLLPKLLIMAVLINFSKTICGLIIDFSQVIMLTFVSSFAEHGPGNFIEMFQTHKIASLWTGAGDVNSWAIVVGIITGVFALIVTNIVVAIMLFVLVMRVVMLWIYVILSPLAFLLSAFPAGAKYAQQWWGEFSKQVIVGPILAFFIWLALTTAKTSSGKLGDFGGDEVCAGVNVFFCSDNFQTFIITIGLLVGGLIVTQQLGGAAGAAAGKGIGWIRSGAALGGYKLPIKGADWLQRKASMSKWAEKAGIKGFDLAPTRMYKRIKEGLDDERRKDIDKMGSAAGESMKEGGFRGLISSLSSPDFAKEVLDGPFALRGIRNVFRGGVDMHSNELEKASKHDAHANAAQTMIGFINKGYDDERLEREFKQEDAYKDLKKTVGEEKANEYFSKIKGFSATDIDDETKERREYSQQHRKMAAKYKIPSAAGDKVFWGGIMEAKSKVSENAEEAIAEAFVGAVEKDDWELASGLALKSAEVNGYNTLLAKMGYSSVHAGFTEEEAKELNKTEAGQKHYQQFKGGHDMFRDIFVKKFGMGNERAFSVEDEISETCLAHGHLYGAKTIANKDGRKVQRSATEQAEATLTEIKKGDAEGLVRKYQKAGFGGHDANGKWQSSDLGQNMMLTYWKTIAKQIEINRWNQSASEEMGKKEEVKKIKKAFDGMVDAVGKENEQVIIEMFGTAKVGDNTKGTVKDFFDRVEQYSKVGGPEFGKIIAAGRAGEKYELKDKGTKKEDKVATKKEDDDGSADLSKIADEEERKRDDRFHGRS